MHGREGDAATEWIMDCISALVSLERDEDVINFNAALTLILRKVTCGSDTTISVIHKKVYITTHLGLWF